MKNFTLLAVVMAASSIFANAQSTATKTNQNLRAEAPQVEDGWVEVLKENFDKLTMGTEDSPASDKLTDDYFNVKPEYTDMYYWSGVSLQSAGGCVYIGEDPNDYYGTKLGFLCTPATLDFSARGGEFTIYFRAKTASKDSEGATLGIIAPHTGDKRKIDITNEWKEYELVLTGGEIQSWVRFMPEKEPMLIDDITIYSTGIDRPRILNPTKYTETSFTANWEAVVTAKSYLLSVYSTDDNTATGNRTYFMEDKEVTGLSYDVTGLSKDKTYWYVVKAKRGEKISVESDIQKVRWILQELSTPKPLPSTDVTDNGFTANWEAVEHASGYALYAFIDHTAPTDGYYTLLDTDFSDIESTGTVDAPEYGAPTASLNDFTNRSDWGANSPVFANGILGLEVWVEQPFIQSPFLDLSGGDGKVNVQFTALTRGPEEVTVGIVEMKEHEGMQYQAIMYSETVKLTNEWAEYSVDLEKGSAESRVVLIPSSQNGCVFFDNLKVSKNLKAGERIVLPLDYYEGPALSHSFDTSDKVDGDRYFWIVSSYGFSEDASVIQSDYCADQYVDNNGGIKTTTAKKTKATINNGVLRISNPESQPISVFDTMGRLVYANSNAPQYLETSLDVKGLIIIKVGEEAFKLIAQ